MSLLVGISGVSEVEVCESQMPTVMADPAPSRADGVDLETFIRGISPAVSKFHVEADSYEWRNDEEYFTAVLACETMRTVAQRLRYNLANAALTPHQRIFAGGESQRLLCHQEFADAIAALSDDFDRRREKKLASLVDKGARRPVIEAFLDKINSTDLQRKIFRHVIVRATSMLPHDQQYSLSAHIHPKVQERRQQSVSVHELHRTFADKTTLASLMEHFDEGSAFVKEQMYRRTLNPALQVSMMSVDVIQCFMGLPLKASNFNAIESPSLQQVLREDELFLNTEAGRSIERQQTHIESNGKDNASTAPAPLEIALKDAKNQGKDIFEVLSVATKAGDRTKAGTAPSAEGATDYDTSRSQSCNVSTDENPPTSAEESDNNEFGYYKSDLEYLEDQIRLMNATIQVKKLRESLRNDNDMDAALSRSKSRGRRDIYAPPPTREDMKTEISLDADKLDTQLEKLRKRIHARLSATKEERDTVPRLEQLQSALRLKEFEKFLLLVLISEVLMPQQMHRYGYSGSGATTGARNVGGYIESVATSLEERMLFRNFFYKSSTLVKENIVSISQSDFTEDLTQCKVQLDRRMLDFIVGLDTELDELVDGSHLYMPNVTLEDVVLPKETKDRVCQSVLKFPAVKDKFKELNVNRKITYGSGQILLFYGASGTGKTMLANAVATSLKKKVLLVNFPTVGLNESGGILKFLFREARINKALLFFDECESMFLSRDKGGKAINMLLTELERFDGLCILATNRPCDLDEAMHRRISLSVEFQKPDHILREEIWSTLHPPKLELDDDIDFGVLARKFELSGGHIKNCWLQSIGLMVQRGGSTVTQEDLSKAASEQVVGSLALEEFDRRVVPTKGVDSMVLGDSVKKSLCNIIDYAKAQTILFGQWGFEKLHQPTTGISACFTGPPGVGKTMAAEAIGFDLGRPLMVVNVAELVSKYVGETGKNIQSVFDDAKSKDAVLVFDEAEGLFGQRGTGTSTSRHDNLNVGLLLQKIESFPGICIVITNMKRMVDEAFFRRFRFVLDFEEPNITQREQLWKATIPEEMPLSDDVSLKSLAHRFEMSGGGIKSSLFRAATRAALRHQASERKVSQKDLEEACVEETGKLGLTRTAADMYA